jgi:hypothetical protein
MHTITSPTGVSVTKELTEEEVKVLQASNYFTVKPNAYRDKTFEDIDFKLEDTSKPSKPRIHISDTGCESCSA